MKGLDLHLVTDMQNYEVLFANKFTISIWTHGRSKVLESYSF